MEGRVGMPFQNMFLLGSVLKCLTRNAGVLGSSHTGSSGLFVGLSLGKTLQSPNLVMVKPRKDMNNVSCRHDMTEILLKAEYNTIQSFSYSNQSVENAGVAFFKGANERNKFFEKKGTNSNV